MLMKVTEKLFLAAFEGLHPQEEKFTPRGLRALYEFLTAQEREDGQERVLDAVALRGEYSEYDSAEEAAEEYGISAEEIGQWEKEHVVAQYAGGVIVRDY